MTLENKSEEQHQMTDVPALPGSRGMMESQVNDRQAPSNRLLQKENWAHYARRPIRRPEPVEAVRRVRRIGMEHNHSVLAEETVG